MTPTDGSTRIRGAHAVLSGVNDLQSGFRRRPLAAFANRRRPAVVFFKALSTGPTLNVSRLSFGFVRVFHRGDRFAGVPFPKRRRRGRGRNTVSSKTVVTPGAEPDDDYGEPGDTAVSYLCAPCYTAVELYSYRCLRTPRDPPATCGTCEPRRHVRALKRYRFVVHYRMSSR